MDEGETPRAVRDVARPRAGSRTRDRPVTNPFYTAGWVRSCLQDESGRTNRACDWPARTCNASGSARTVPCRAGYRVKAGLPCLPARRPLSPLQRTRFSAVQRSGVYTLFPPSPFPSTAVASLAAAVSCYLFPLPPIAPLATVPRPLDHPFLVRSLSLPLCRCIPESPVTFFPRTRDVIFLIVP